MVESASYYWQHLTHFNERAAPDIKKAKDILENAKKWIGWYNRVAGSYAIKGPVMKTMEGAIGLLGKAQKFSGYISELQKVTAILNAISKAQSANPNGENSLALAALFGQLISALSGYLTGFPGAGFYASQLDTIGKNFSSIYGAFDPWHQLRGLSESDKEEYRKCGIPI